LLANGTAQQLDLHIGRDLGAKLTDDLAIDLDQALLDVAVGFPTRTQSALSHQL
jgi:hypothetical protein